MSFYPPLTLIGEQLVKQYSVGLNLKRICVIENDPCIISENRLALYALVERLAQEDYHVTVLIVQLEALEWWKKKYENQSKNLTVTFLSYSGPPVSSLSSAVQSYHVMEWLLKNSSTFDCVHFPLTNGVPYYTLLAKHQGWAFQETLFYLDCPSCLLWKKYHNQQWVEHIDDLAVDFLERESVRLTDWMSSSDQLFNWMNSQEWCLPKKIFLYSKENKSTAYLNFYDKIQAFCQLQPSFHLPLIEQIIHQPLVTVCLTHFNRPHYLLQALDSLRAQDYPNFEVVLVDDASTQPEAITFLKSLEDEFRSKGWKIIRNEKNLFPGAARNLAARQSKGDYLLFMDDDNYAVSHQISTFVQIAQKVNADILTCAMDVFKGSEAPSVDTLPIHRFLPIGAAKALGLYLNLFGDMNALIKRQVYESLNGLTEEREVGGEDWEFFSRAVLQGCHLETIPLPLFWYRDTPRSITKTTHLYANCLRGIRPYLDSVPEVIRKNLMLGYAQQELLQKLLIERQNLKQLLKHCSHLFFSRLWKAINQPQRTLKKILDRF